VSKWNSEVSVLIVNDASTEDRPKDELVFKKIKSVRIINMAQNRGHARCNAAGLKYLNEKENLDYVILMDGDGEDRPEELNLLFKKSIDDPTKTITATADFIMDPIKITPYLIKTECFCFTKQTLAPGESQIFVMVFFLDPSLDLDKDLDKTNDLVFTYQLSEYKS